MTTGHATFKCDHVFPSLKSLIGCTSAQEAYAKAYPHAIHELKLKAVIDTPQGEETEAITHYKALIRDDGLEIAVVKNSYTVVQPKTICDQFAPFIDSGLVDLIAGGSLNSGTRISVIARIKGSEREVVPGEEIGAFVNFYAGLDGSLGIGGNVFGVQMRCLNGMCVSASKFEMSLKHTKNVHYKLSDARQAIAKTINDFQKSTEAYKVLAATRVSRSLQETYVRRVLTGKEITDPEAAPRTEAKVKRVIELLDTQKGLELVPAVRGTAWQAYSAVTEYLTHEIGRNEDTRLNSRLFGESNNLNRQALNLAMQM